MRARFLLTFSTLLSFAVGLSTGCGDDENKNPATTDDPDASTDGATTDPTTLPDATSGDAPSDAPQPTTITLAVSDLNLYLGQIALLDATGSTLPPGVTPTFAWTVESAPTGSGISTATLFNAGSARASFTPDAVGDYTLKLVVTAGEATADKTVLVKAFEASLYYLYAENDGGPLHSMGIRAQTAQLDASVRSLSCQTHDAGSFATANLYPALGGTDFWESPPGGNSKVVYGSVSVVDGGAITHLNVVTDQSTCATSPVELDRQEPGAVSFVHPRFSPNGQRVVYVRNQPSVGDRLVSIGVDGTDRRTVGAFLALPDGGPRPDASVSFVSGVVLSPRWVDDTKVAWLQFTTGGAWQIVVADDVDGAPQSLYMSCSAVDAGASERPTDFALAKDGSVIIGQRVSFEPGKLGARDLLLFEPNATTKACELVRNLTNFPSDGGASFATVGDFSISPDGTQIAFMATDPGVDAGPVLAPTRVWTVAIDGLTPPVPLPGAPAAGGFIQAGPRYIAGGAELVWPQDQRSIDAGTGSAPIVSVLAASAGGGNVRLVANSANSNNTIATFANGHACSIAAAGGSGVFAVGAGAAFVSLLLRRRRKAN